MDSWFLYQADKKIINNSVFLEKMFLSLWKRAILISDTWILKTLCIYMQITEDCINAIFKYWFKCDRWISFFFVFSGQLYNMWCSALQNIETYELLQIMYYWQFLSIAAAIDYEVSLSLDFIEWIFLVT